MINETLGSKKLYKLFLIIVKFIPNILALIQIISLILNYFGRTSFFLTCIGGTSISLLLILYLISFIFRFCGLYRLSLNYISLITLLTVLDYYIGIPLNTEHLYFIYAILSGVFAMSWVYLLYKNRNNPKVDYIKQLCERYIVCCK